MAHGTPDWGHGKQEVTYSLTDDLAELAARLGSINVYDRRGDTIWWDDFNEGLGAWVTGTSGTGGSVATDTTYCKWPPNSAKLVGGSTGSRYARIINYQPAPVVKRIGLEFCVNFTQAFDRFQFYILLEDPPLRKIAQIQLDYTNSEIYYSDTDGNWVKLDDLGGEHITLISFSSLKLVADFEANEYMRLMFNRTVYDMTGIALYNPALTDDTRLTSDLIMWSAAGKNHFCYIDGVIITQNEP